VSSNAQISAPVGSATQRASLKRRITASVILILAAFTVYFPVLHGNWLWDDTTLIRDNPVMADAGGVWKFWLAPPGPDFFPLTSTVEWSLWRIFGDHTLPYHLLSLALHLLSAFLIWRLFTRLGLRLAWLGALLFVVHPLAVESVAWISELKNTLLLFSLLFWLNYDERTRPTDFCAALVFFLLALLAKTSVVMLPFILLLHAWWKHGGITREKFLAIAPFFIVSMVLGLLTLFFQNLWAIGTEPIDAGGLSARAIGAGQALFFYMGKLFWPVNLLPTYPPWHFDQISPVQFLPWVLIVAVLGFLIAQRSSACCRAMLLGLGFFVINLAPVLGFLNMSYMRIAWVADHFTYLPMLGVIGLVVAGLDKVLTILPRLLLAPAAGILVLLLFTLGWQASNYAANFRSPLALWSYTARSLPSSWIAEMNLGMSLVDLQDLPDAVEHLTRAAQINNDYYGTHLVLANTLSQMKRYDDAAQHYFIAEHLRPESLEVHVNYGAVLLTLGDVHGAEVQCEMAVYFHPDSVAAHYNYANILLRENRPRDAILQYQAALQLQPGFTPARVALDKLHAAIAPPAAT